MTKKGSINLLEVILKQLHIRYIVYVMFLSASQNILKQIQTIDITCSGISLFRRLLLNSVTNNEESLQVPIQSPSKKILCSPCFNDEVSSANCLMPQSSNLSRRGSSTVVLTRPKLAKFLTSPQFSPSGVERKHIFPQCEGCLHHQFQLSLKLIHQIKSST